MVSSSGSSTPVSSIRDGRRRGRSRPPAPSPAARLPRPGLARVGRDARRHAARRERLTSPSELCLLLREVVTVAKEPHEDQLALARKRRRDLQESSARRSSRTTTTTGPAAGLAATSPGGTSSGSWRSIARSSSWSAGLGSIPSSSTKVRAPRGMPRAPRPACPARYSATHQHRAWALTQRMLANERLDLADDLGVPAAREIGLDPELERAHPQLLEPRDLRLRERLVREVPERRAAPERERLAKQLGRRVRSRARRLAHEPLERRRSRSLRPTRRTYPGGCVTIESAPSDFRSCDTWYCSALAALCGGSPATARRSAGRPRRPRSPASGATRAVRVDATRRAAARARPRRPPPARECGTPPAPRATLPRSLSPSSALAQRRPRGLAGWWGVYG